MKWHSSERGDIAILDVRYNMVWITFAPCAIENAVLSVEGSEGTYGVVRESENVELSVSCDPKVL